MEKEKQKESKPKNTKESGKEKTDIIEYHKNCQVVCSCGNVFKVGATVSAIKTEICSACHPFYTGNSKVLDIAGRIDKFEAKMKKFAEFKKNSPKSKNKIGDTDAE